MRHASRARGTSRLLRAASICKRGAACNSCCDGAPAGAIVCGIMQIKGSCGAVRIPAHINLIPGNKRFATDRKCHVHIILHELVGDVIFLHALGHLVPCYVYCVHACCRIIQRDLFRIVEVVNVAGRRQVKVYRVGRGISIQGGLRFRPGRTASYPGR